MPGLFRRNRQQQPEHEEDLLVPQAPAPPRRIGDYSPFVPASARAPEHQRFANYDVLEDDEHDGDVAFLEQLAGQIPDREPAKRQPAPNSDAAPPQAALLRRSPRERAVMPKPAKPDNLQVFRDTPIEAEKPDIARVVHIDDTDMGDLLESLHTVAAALRRRKAA